MTITGSDYSETHDRDYSLTTNDPFGSLTSSIDASQAHTIAFRLERWDRVAARYVRRYGEAAFVARLQDRMAKADITLRPRLP